MALLFLLMRIAVRLEFSTLPEKVDSWIETCRSGTEISVSKSGVVGKSCPVIFQLHLSRNLTHASHSSSATLHQPQQG